MAVGTVLKAVTTTRSKAVEKALANLPENIRKIADHAMLNPLDPQYKCAPRTGKRIKGDSRRIKIKRNKYRALAVVTETTTTIQFDWYFLGTHAEYDSMF